MEKFIVNGKDFIEAVRKTADIALIPKPKHQSHLINTCIIVHDDKVDFASIDSGMLIVHTIPAKVEKAESKKRLINTKALKYIADRTLNDDEIEITIENKAKTTSYEPDAIITFKSNNYNLKTKLLGGFLYEEYPDYRKVIPKQYDAIVEISKQDLVDALNKAVSKRTWINDKFGEYEVVCLKTSAKGISIEAPDYTSGKMTYRTVDVNAVVKSNEDIRAFVRDIYLGKILNLIDNDDIVMHINDFLRIVITPKTQGKAIGIVETTLPLWD
jgi:DNA polymerase III sliding clamp (beta) subunit (PCNA family)